MVTRDTAIDAIQVTGDIGNYLLIRKFCGVKSETDKVTDLMPDFLDVRVGDYIVKDSEGNLRRIDPCTFYSHYEDVLAERGWQDVNTR